MKNLENIEKLVKEIIPAKQQIKSINEELLKIIRDYDLLEKKLQAENQFLINKITGLEKKFTGIYSRMDDLSESLHRLRDGV